MNTRYSEVVDDMRLKLYAAMDRFDDRFNSEGLYGGGRYLPSPDA